MTTKRFLRFQIILLILLIISIGGNAFAWANRPVVKGGGFMSDDKVAIKLQTDEYYINGNSCTAVTYMGTRNEETGEIAYNETTPITEFTDNDLTKGEVHYFKTVITNTSDVKTNISLFISGYTDNDLTSALFGVSTPITKTNGFPESSYNYSEGKRYYEFAPVISEYEMGPANNGTPATAKIEWFVFYNDSSDESHHGEFHLSDIIFTNN